MLLKTHFCLALFQGCVSIATVDSSNICVCGSSLVNKNQEGQFECGSFIAVIFFLLILFQSILNSHA